LLAASLLFHSQECKPKNPSRTVPSPLLWIQQVYQNATLLARRDCLTLHLM